MICHLQGVDDTGRTIPQEEILPAYNDYRDGLAVGFVKNLKNVSVACVVIQKMLHN